MSYFAQSLRQKGYLVLIFYLCFTEDLQSCAKTGFNIDEKIEVQVESSDDDEFCPKQIHVWFAKDHEFHTKQINYDFIDYSDATKNPWHKLIQKGHH